MISHSLVVDENIKDEYIDILSKVNYYRFTGYALQFRKSENDSNFIKGTTFEYICDIYLYNQELRNILRKYIEIVEVYYRTQISYNFALVKCNKEPYDQHYDESNYYNKEGVKEVPDSFEKERNYYKDSLIGKHHKDKYSNKMPLWVMVELMSFSNISKLYSSMYFSEKDKIAQAVGTGRNTLENNLHCLSVLRNKCAHAARLYNTDFNPPANLSVNLLRKNPNIQGFKNMKIEIKPVQIDSNTIKEKIYFIRGQKVMLDKDLAEIYSYEVKRFTEQVNRNIDRFDEDFMFKLTQEEYEILKSQFATSSWGGSRKIPNAFTEQGIYI